MKLDQERDIRIFGLAISHWPRWLILILGASGIFISFLVQGTSQEALYTNSEFNETIFFTLIQFFGYFLLTSGFFFRLVTNRVRLHASVRYYAFTSLCLVCSMGLSNLSVERLSYPTAVLFKSSKLIPVMIGGWLFLKKRYSILEVLSIGLIVCGLIGISYSDKVSKNRFDLIGVLLSSISLCFDALASNLQENALDAHGASQTEVISMMYFIGSCYLFVVSLVSGQLVRGAMRCVENPMVIWYLSSFAFLGAIGVHFVYLLMKTFGSLVTVMVTSTRKAFTVCLSFLLFKTKKFTTYHALSICAIASGLALHYIGKQKKKPPIDEEALPFLPEKKQPERESEREIDLPEFGR
jgi:adenosine 3'-phospho 5'-phosphosulfate transporter B3